jgi:peptidoglycan/LPS O-acetylase OafA/YrhL
MRGVAALIVCLSHFGVIFLPNTTSLDAKNWGVGEHAIEMSVANILINGHFAVCLFFVLSGYVLSQGFMVDGDPARIWKAAAKRYPRLMLPALASVLFAWAALKTGSSHFAAVIPLTGRHIDGSDTTTISFGSAVIQGAYGVFFSGEFSLNGILWTIRTEFYGSFLVFGLLLAFGRSSWRWAGYGAAIVLLYSTYYMAFPIGVAIAALTARERPGGAPLLALAIAGIGLILASYPNYSAREGIWIVPLVVFGEDARLISRILGAACLLLAATLSPAARSIDHPISRFLGRISYSVYLIHYTILSSLTCGLVLWLAPVMGYLPAIGAAFAITMPAVVLAAYAFTRLIDEPATRLADRFALRLMGLRPVPSRITGAVLRLQRVAAPE